MGTKVHLKYSRRRLMPVKSLKKQEMKAAGCHEKPREMIPEQREEATGWWRLQQERRLNEYRNEKGRNATWWLSSQFSPDAWMYVWR